MAAISERNSSLDDERAFLSIAPLLAQGAVVIVSLLFSRVQQAKGMDVELSSDGNYYIVPAELMSLLTQRMRDKDHLIIELEADLSEIHDAPQTRRNVSY